MKLIPLKQWICDTCGEIINSPEQGYFQFNVTDKKIDYFIIVHHNETTIYSIF